MTDRVPVDLDRALRALAPSVEFPPVGDLPTQVSVRLGASTAPRWRWRWARPVLLAASLTLLLVATAVALAWVLPGLRIVPVASVPPAPTAELGTGLALGDLADVEASSVRVGALGTPDAAFVNRDGDVTTSVYAPGPGLPPMSATSGIGLLLQRVEGTLDRSMVMKLVEEVGARVVPVTVDGSDGFWIAGPPHLVRYLAPDGTERSEMTRLAGDTLVWQDGSTLYRMESELELEAALRLAASVETGTGGR